VEPDRWLAECQDLRFDSGLVHEAARSVKRIGTLARESALSLPFDTDPTAFRRILESLAEWGRDL
jgi:hypothetical protein